MARAATCYACAWGNHEKHDRDFGIVPELIGGMYCDCKGDCKERHEEESRKIAESLRKIWDVKD